MYHFANENISVSIQEVSIEINFICYVHKKTTNMREMILAGALNIYSFS